MNIAELHYWKTRNRPWTFRDELRVRSDPFFGMVILKLNLILNESEIWRR